MLKNSGNLSQLSPRSVLFNDFMSPRRLKYFGHTKLDSGWGGGGGGEMVTERRDTDISRVRWKQEIKRSLILKIQEAGEVVTG